MSHGTSQARLALKTPEGAFLQVLQTEFNFSRRVAGEVLQTAQVVLVGTAAAQTIRPGQIRLLVASLKTPFGPPLAETAQMAVTLTVDSGAEDAEVQAQQGREGLRRGRILRLLDEALAQGGVLSQEDLGRVLQVDARTIRRDVQTLKQAGHLIPSRGQLKGVGHGQTHKVRIIELWLDREGYDQIARWVHHTPQAIKHYVSTFLRVVVLHRRQTPVEKIAFLTQSSVRLMQDYLQVYEAALQHPPRREKLAEELVRVSQRAAPQPPAGEKGGLSQ